jgi:hypothetical protein
MFMRLSRNRVGRKDMTDAFPGTPSDELPEVLATGRTDIAILYVSMSRRHPEGRDAEYLKWHSFDHRPEQYRLAKVRSSLRLVSTPACRAARAASDSHYDGVDHVMTYFFADVAGLKEFIDLAGALGNGGRIPYLLPMVERAVYRFDRAVAASRIKIGADVLPWWPAKGAYLLIERGQASASELVEVPGVGGAWWGGALPLEAPTVSTPTTGLNITYCLFDGEPVETADRLRPFLDRRWAASGVQPLFAAPFHVLDPYQLDRFLP